MANQTKLNNMKLQLSLSVTDVFEILNVLRASDSSGRWGFDIDVRFEDALLQANVLNEADDKQTFPYPNAFVNDSADSYAYEADDGSLDSLDYGVNCVEYDGDGYDEDEELESLGYSTPSPAEEDPSLLYYKWRAQQQEKIRALAEKEKQSKRVVSSNKRDKKKRKQQKKQG